MSSRQGFADLWGGSISRYCKSREIGLAYRSGAPYIQAIPSSRVLTFAVTLADPAQLSQFLALDEQLALFLQVPQVRMRRYLGRVMVEVPLPERLWAFVDANQLKGGEGMRVALGMTTLQTTVYVTVNADAVAPLLLAGRTGSGKTEAMRTIIWRLAQQNTPEQLKMIVYDPKRKFQAIHSLPHLLMPLLQTPKDAMLGLAWLIQELHKRAAGASCTPAILCVVDELIDIMQHNQDAGKEYLGTLARLGRELGITLIMGTQRPSRKYMDDLLAANIGLRIAGKVPDPAEATMASGIGGSGAQHLLNKGDMLVVGSEIHRIQVAMTSMRHFAGLPQTDEPPKMPELPESVSTLLGRMGGVVSPRFSDREYAVALTGIGIMALKDALNIGQPKATDLRRWAVPKLAQLQELGYNVTRVEDATPKGDESCEEAVEDTVE